ncbi:MAG: hypothetical protein ABIF84_01680 [Patescibacteria group bacterium]
MLSNLKDFVKQRYSDIILTIGIILIALASFGAGLLIDLSESRGEIIIQNPTASIQQAASPEKSTEQGKFVGSVNSNKYHWLDCPSAKKIAPENQIWFDSEEQAQTAGYIRCGNFEKYSN